MRPRTADFLQLVSALFQPAALTCSFLCLLSLCSWKVPAAEPGHDYSRWEPEIAAFEQSDRTNPPPKGGILFIGSSTIRLWETLAADFPKHQVINRGFGGSEIADATHFVDRVIFPYQPRMVFLRAGGNDIHAGKSPAEVFADFQEFVPRVRSRLPDTKVAFISLCPSVARWAQAPKERSLNEMVRQYAGVTPGIIYIETYTMSLGPDGLPRPNLFGEDKLHFNAAGYKLLAERVRPFLP